MDAHQRRFLLVAIGVTFCSTLEMLWNVSSSNTSHVRGLGVANNRNEDIIISALLETNNHLAKRVHRRPVAIPYNETVPEWWSPCELIHPNSKQTSDARIAKDDVMEQPPISYRLDDSVATILHVGKSAGGTLVERAFQCWRTFMRVCHPRPCRPQQQQISKSSSNGIIITLRDPIDRFVSSFYWRLLVVCDYNDKRRRNKAAAHNPQRYCNRPLHGERKVMEYYHRDASRFAERLCTADATTNQTERTLAMQNLQSMEHAKYTLHDHWLNKNVVSWSPENLFPIVTESNLTDIERQTDQAIQWLHDRTHFESSSDFRQRARYAQQRRVAGDVSRHSSRGYQKKLTAAAERCLARYFHKDYELLRELERLACKTDDCHHGLQSILTRRAALLME